jgi:hypothetical protein
VEDLKVQMAPVDIEQLYIPLFLLHCSELPFTAITINGSVLAILLNKLNPPHHLPHFRNSVISYHSQSNGALLNTGQRITGNALQMQ